MNEGETISIRGLTSENAEPAVSPYGTLCPIDARLTGGGDAAKIPAIAVPQLIACTLLISMTGTE